MPQEEKYKDLAKEIEELLKYIAEGEKEREEISPLLSDSFDLNEDEYRRFKSILYFIHFLSDIDNDEIDYELQENQTDMEIIWKSPGIYLSKENKGSDIFSKLILMADSYSVTISGLDEISVRMLVKNLVKRKEK